MTAAHVTEQGELEASARIHRVRAQIAENNNREAEAHRHRARLAKVQAKLDRFKK